VAVHKCRSTADRCERIYEVSSWQVNFESAGTPRRVKRYTLNAIRKTRRKEKRRIDRSRRRMETYGPSYRARYRRRVVGFRGFGRFDSAWSGIMNLNSWPTTATASGKYSASRIKIERSSICQRGT